MPEKITVRARGTALVPDFTALDRGVRRMIGRTYQETPAKSGQWGWVPSGKSEEFAPSVELAKALAAGDLFAGDKETAEWAASVTRKPVTYDPTFGGPAVDEKAAEPAKEKTR